MSTKHGNNYTHSWHCWSAVKSPWPPPLLLCRPAIDNAILHYQPVAVVSGSKNVMEGAFLPQDVQGTYLQAQRRSGKQFQLGRSSPQRRQQQPQPGWHSSLREDLAKLSSTASSRTTEHRSRNMLLNTFLSSQFHAYLGLFSHE